MKPHAEQRRFRRRQKDAGELGAGHRVTAIYEVKLADNRSFSPQGMPEGRNAEIPADQGQRDRLLQ